MTQIIRPNIYSLIAGIFFLFSPLAVMAKSGGPNGINNSPQPGWTLWYPKAEAQKADYDSGFSNIELGGYLDFENACKTNAGVPEEKIEYWFRLSNSVQRIGTGEVETGCWVNGRFLHTQSSTAIKSSLKNVNCLRVNSPTGNRLFIRSEPKLNSQVVGVVRNGRTVRLDSFPANIITADNQNWVNITSPVKGWISDGTPTGSGNLRLCRK